MWLSSSEELCMCLYKSESSQEFSRFIQLNCPQLLWMGTVTGWINSQMAAKKCYQETQVLPHQIVENRAGKDHSRSLLSSEYSWNIMLTAVLLCKYSRTVFRWPIPWNKEYPSWYRRGPLLCFFLCFHGNITSATAFLCLWHKAKCIHASWPSLWVPSPSHCTRFPTATSHFSLCKGWHSTCEAVYIQCLWSSSLPASSYSLFPKSKQSRKRLLFSSSTPKFALLPLPGILCSLSAPQVSYSETGVAYTICPLPLPEVHVIQPALPRGCAGVLCCDKLLLEAVVWAVGRASCCGCEKHLSFFSQIITILSRRLLLPEILEFINASLKSYPKKHRWRKKHQNPVESSLSC